MPNTRKRITPLHTALRELRLQRGIYQQVVAHMLGMGQRSISDYERGYGTPSAGLVAEWAGILRADPAPLLWLWLRQHIGTHLADRMAASPHLSTDPTPEPSVREQLAAIRAAADRIEAALT